MAMMSRAVMNAAAAVRGIGRFGNASAKRGWRFMSAAGSNDGPTFAYENMWANATPDATEYRKLEGSEKHVQVLQVSGE